MLCDGTSIFAGSNQRTEAVLGGQVLNGNEFAGARMIFGGIDGPGQAGHMPLDSFHSVEFLLADLRGHLPKLPAGDAVSKERIELGRALGSAAAMGQAAHQSVELLPIQGAAPFLGRAFGAKVFAPWLALSNASGSSTARIG